MVTWQCLALLFCVLARAKGMLSACFKNGVKTMEELSLALHGTGGDACSCGKIA